MSVPLIVEGNSYQYPSQGDKANTGWGNQTTNWASAVTSALTKLGLGGTLSPIANAVINIDSTSKGILIPRMTTAQRNAISSPSNSLLIFNTDLKVLQYYDLSVTSWISVGARLPDNVVFSGTLTVNGNITGLGSISATSGINGATGNFTDTTDATNADNAPLKTLGGMAVKKKLFVGTDFNVGGNANITGNTTLTGQTLTSDGNALLPGISFISDPNTGLYRIGSDNIGFTTNGLINGQITTSGWIISPQYACFVDEKAATTEGGTFTSGDWRTRVLNTTRGTNSITGSSLSSNQFILPSGSYRILASCPAYFVELHQCKLRNITDSSNVLIGTSEYCATAVGVSNRSFLSGIFTITAQKTFEIQHRCTQTQSSNGFGRGYSDFGNVQVYTIVEIWKLS